MSNKTSLSRLLACFIAALAVLVACSKGTDVGGDSHFVCKADPDCAAHGAGLVCVDSECQSAPDAANVQGNGGVPTGDATAGGARIASTPPELNAPRPHFVQKQAASPARHEASGGCTREHWETSGARCGTQR